MNADGRAGTSTGFGARGLLHIDDGEAAAERMGDEGMALVDHDLRAVGAAALIATADEGDVVRALRCDRFGHGHVPAVIRLKSKKPLRQRVTSPSPKTPARLYGSAAMKASAAAALVHVDQIVRAQRRHAVVGKLGAGRDACTARSPRDRRGGRAGSSAELGASGAVGSVDQVRHGAAPSSRRRGGRRPWARAPRSASGWPARSRVDVVGKDTAAALPQLVGPRRRMRRHAYIGQRLERRRAPAIRHRPSTTDSDTRCR